MRAPRIDPAVAEEVLTLAAVVAHTQERRFAPLAAYIAGQAVADPDVDAAALIRNVREQLERPEQPR